MNCCIIDSGVNGPEENMAFDAQLLAEASSSSKPVLHLYDWAVPSATYGHFIKPFGYFDKEKLENSNLKLARRPTGGGIIFHEFDLAYSVFVPAAHPLYSINTLDNYALVNRMTGKAVERFCGGKGTALLPLEKNPLDTACNCFCMANPTKFDIMIDGRKVGGGAQRRTRRGFLHQGSIALKIPSEDYLAALLKPGFRVYEGMLCNSFPLLSPSSGLKELQEARRALRQLMAETFQQPWTV